MGTPYTFLLGMAACAFATSTASSQNREWLPRVPLTAPAGRYASELAYDPIRDRVVMFGGLGDSGDLSDTWEYDGFNWVQRFPATSPTPRHAHALFWDPVSQNVVLFGGTDGNTLNDTWIWDGVNWSQHTQASPVPSPRFLPCIGTTPATPGVLMLGGQFTPPSSTFLADFWNWDGTQWVLLATTTPIGPRSQGRMAYDPVRAELLLVGGHSTTPVRVFYNDTWSFDGVGWTQLSVGTYGPPRATPVFQFVPDLGRCILFGGYGDPTPYADTWELTPSGWQIIPTSTTPPARFSAGSVVRDALGRLFMFGGYNNLSAMQDTWVFGESDPPGNTAFGSGCSSSRGTPVLSALRPAWRGEFYDLRLSGLPPTTPFLLLGNRATTPVDLTAFGAPGCELLLDPGFSVAIGVHVSGVAAWSFVVPPLSSLGTLTWQGVVLDPGANALGAAFSNGLETVVR
ncbi:MAG: hypothetical protein ACE37K_17210 [Planctomycetota bacterium]